MKKLLSLIFWAKAAMLFSQTPHPDSLWMWFDVSFNDSLQTLTLSPKLLNRSDLPGYFYYQIRITDASLQPGNVIEKITGLIFAAPADTSEIAKKTLSFNPALDFNVYLYLLEEEYVVASTVWNFDDAYSSFKKREAKPKAKPLFLAKDDFEIDVLVFNETRTPFGREFFRRFSELWQVPQGASGYWITIREALTPGRFTLISVSLNNKELFQRYLAPRSVDIANLAQQTVIYLQSLIQNNQYDGSLTTDDLFGTGID